MNIKKILGGLTLGLALVVGATQAQAALLTDWSYTLGSTTLENVNTNFATVGTNGSISFNTGSYGVTLNPEGNASGDMAFAGDNSAAHTKNDPLLGQTTDNDVLENTPATKLADMTFTYNVVSIENPEVRMNITYSIPLYTYYDAATSTSYIYYNNSEVSTRGATAITHDDYAYGITGVGLFVDGRALVSLPGAEGDPNLYSGWAINNDTVNNHYEEYVVGGDSNVSIGAKDVVGEFDITGVFSITNSKIETEATPTPEPATMILTGLGLAGLGAIKRRRGAK